MESKSLCVDEEYANGFAIEEQRRDGNREIGIIVDAATEAKSATFRVAAEFERACNDAREGESSDDADEAEQGWRNNVFGVLQRFIIQDEAKNQAGVEQIDDQAHQAVVGSRIQPTNTPCKIAKPNHRADWQQGVKDEWCGFHT